MKKKAEKQSSIFHLVAINVLLVAAVVVSFLYYNSAYKEELAAENLSNISNINSSASNIALANLRFKKEKLADVRYYSELHTLDPKGLLDYMYDSTEPERVEMYQLIGGDCKGWVTKKDGAGEYAAVDYSASSYENIRKIIGKVSAGTDEGLINYTPEFTDNCSGVRVFAYYVSIKLDDGAGSLVPYTLMLVTESKDLLEAINSVGGYEGMATVLMAKNGNYIVSSNSFKDVNLFDYFYTYNSLVLDERNAVMNEVISKNSGEVYFNDYRNNPCVFRFSGLKDIDWYCVTEVPLDSFRENDMEISFTLAAVGILLILTATDVLWFVRINRKLSGIMKKERIANNAKTDFLSRMSHDIRTPLNGIIGTAYLAQKEDNPPLTAEYLRVIDTSGKFLLGLVNDVLDMSKVESGKMELHLERYCYAELCDYVNSVIKPLCDEKGVVFKITGEADKTPVMADRLRTNQIFFNLLSNAVKFTPEGGMVELVMSSRRLDNNRMSEDFIVRDTGIGMSEEFQKHMFEAFSQEGASTTRAASGTGLGLAIVRNLVKLIDGTISVKSKPGEGTEFTIHFESEICDDTSSAEEERKTDLTKLQGKNVLLCEDNEINTMLAKRLLEAKGMTVDAAEDGSIGVERFISSEKGYYDAILMDIMMPVLDGLTAAAEIRHSDHPDAKTVPIIAMTANAYAEDIENCINAGMNDHVSKPVNPSELYEKLANSIM